MKPSKNRIYCYACRRAKMLFPTKEKADNFMNFNGEEIFNETGKAPVRSYFCEVCGGYHVTSNPSTEDGERINNEIHRKIQQIHVSSENAEDITRIQQRIYNRVEKAKGFLNFGLVSEAEDLLDICELEQDDLKDLDPLGKSLVRVNGKIFGLKNKIAKVKEYLSLNDSQIQSLLEDESFRKKKSERQTLSNIFEVRKLWCLILSADEHVENGDYPSARKLLSQSKDGIAKLSGEGKKLVKKKLEAKIEEIEKLLLETKSNPASSKKQPYNPLDKKTILSIIERIELATKAYEQNDMSSCETHIEIAEYMIYESGITDENTEILNRQLAHLRQQLIADGYISPKNHTSSCVLLK